MSMTKKQRCVVVVKRDSVDAKVLIQQRCNIMPKKRPLPCKSTNARHWRTTLCRSSNDGCFLRNKNNVVDKSIALLLVVTSKNGCCFVTESTPVISAAVIFMKRTQTWKTSSHWQKSLCLLRSWEKKMKRNSVHVKNWVILRGLYTSIEWQGLWFR